jgi:hypothetical protein
MLNAAQIVSITKITAAAVALAALTMAPTIAPMAQQYEAYGVRRAADILPPGLRSGPHFKVHEKVVSFDYLHSYVIDTDFGRFEVTGDGALRKLVREIAAIAALKNTETAEAVAQSLVAAAKGPFELVGNLITDPVGTISGIPQGLGQIVGNAGTAMTTERDPSEDSQLKQLLFVSSWKRSFAVEHGVDVYSSNKVLQKELNRVGWAAALAGLSISVATMGTSATGVEVAKNMRLANSITNALNEEPPSRLRIINQEKFAKIGISKALTGRFLDHPSYTPRHDTIIAECLVQMAGTRGLDAFIEYILQAQDEVGANFFQQMAEIMRGYHTTTSPLVEIRIVAGLAVAQARNGRALVPIAIDHGVWLQRAEGMFDHIRANHRPAGFNGNYDLWVAGTISALAKEKLAARGFSVTENVDVRIGFMD